MLRVIGLRYGKRPVPENCRRSGEAHKQCYGQERKQNTFAEQSDKGNKTGQAANTHASPSFLCSISSAILSFNGVMSSPPMIRAISRTRAA